MANADPLVFLLATVMALSPFVLGFRSKRRRSSWLPHLLVGTYIFSSSLITKSEEETQSQQDKAHKSVTSFTVQRPVEELYEFWRDLTNLPRIMEYVHAVEAHDGHTHWKARFPAGIEAEWRTQIIEDRPNQAVAWRSMDGSGLKNSGSVQFSPAPADKGVEVTLELEFDLPGGALGDAAEKLLDPAAHLFTYKAMHKFKCLMETGEIPTLRFNPAARNGGSDK